ncbi:hypothetical protein [Jannaschia sp. R86511]|uniref:hypothetical protein n=1 Tax=Jannaschia sp. R86511 TaxID=3093853 RepID=UPI0036D27E85
MRGPGTRPAAGIGSVLLLASTGVAGVLVGSTVDAGAGTAIMVGASLLPSAVLGSRLVRARTDLAHESWLRHRLAGEVAVSDDQLRRLADRVEALTDRSSDHAAELERTRVQLRRARVELATSRAVLAGVREQVARARSATQVATASRDDARSLANAARAEAEAAAATARRAEAALARAEAGVRDPWPAPAQVVGQRSFASVDLRVFDAFAEADLAADDAVLDAPARRGRHAAGPALDPVADATRAARRAEHEAATAARAVPTRTVAAGGAGLRGSGARDVA